jgi:hypothetical protein
MCHYFPNINFEELPPSNFNDISRVQCLNNIPKIRFEHPNIFGTLPENVVDTLVAEDYQLPDILIYRNPKDVIVSWYYHRKSKFMDTYSNISEYILEEREGGFECIIEYYNFLLEANPRLFGMSYESLKIDTLTSLKLLLKELGLDWLNQEAIKRAVKLSDFKRMQAFEVLEKPELDGDRLHTRKGIIGGYKEEVSQEVIQWMDNRLLGLNPDYDY